MINSSRAPPRPTPSLVNYSDEDSAKGYDENPDDSDSLTEKPSEISSTDSQVSFILISLADTPSLSQYTFAVTSVAPSKFILFYLSISTFSLSFISNID